MVPLSPSVSLTLTITAHHKLSLPIGKHSWEINRVQADLSKQFVTKTAALKQQLPKINHPITSNEEEKCLCTQ
ncbi:hypothetical protein PMSD_23435 [Paenibacillus macquariensis subsp. defensor]|nr:hypothetical protein PMSD_23435 [Paenibacillus macquariensis subsp. defensor]